jgi:hypothetical protein
LFLQIEISKKDLKEIYGDFISWLAEEHPKKSFRFELKLTVISRRTNTTLFFQRSHHKYKDIDGDLLIQVLPFDFQDFICTEHTDYTLVLRIRLVDFPQMNGKYSNEWEGQISFTNALKSHKYMLETQYLNRIGVQMGFVGNPWFEFQLVVPRLMLTPPFRKYRLLFIVADEPVEVVFAKWDFQCPLCLDEHDSWTELSHHLKLDHTLFEALIIPAVTGQVGSLEEVILQQIEKKEEDLSDVKSK